VIMTRHNASWLAGFLVVLCAALWLLRGMSPSGLHLLSQETPQLSPMDMPDWYRIPMQHGAQFREIGAVSDLSDKQVTKKRMTVRGF
jgi:hypothetical protein